MYAVAYLFESRTPSLTIFDDKHVPVWHMQSRAFLPGDFGLAAFVAAASPKLPTSPRATFVAVIAFLIAFIVLRYGTYKPSHYKKAAWNSWSKRYHDYVIASVFTFTAVTWWWPIFSGQEAIGVWQIIFALSGIIVWLAGLVWDSVKKQVPNDYQHPVNGMPLWR